MSFWSSLISIVPSVIGGITSLAGGASSSRANRQAAADIRAGYEDANDIYQQAYDDVLGFDLDSLGLDGEIWNTQMGALMPFYSGQAAGQADQYATGARGAATRYGDQMYAADDRLRYDLLYGDELYGTGMMQGAQSYQGVIDPAYAAASGMLDPYSDAGRQALGALQGVIARGADELTPGQMRSRDRSLRDMRANIAASGLRGAGRAGAAAINEGVGAVDAGFYDQNQQRIDDAMRVLSSMGYGATGTQAGMETDRGAKVGSAWRSAINDAAGHSASTINQLGQSSYGTGRDVAQGNLRVDDATLQTDMRYGDRYGDQTAGLIGNYYDAARQRAAAEADARASSIMGKAGSAATAVAGPAFSDAQMRVAQGRNRADTLGALGSFVSDGLKVLNTSKSPSFAPV